MRTSPKPHFTNAVVERLAPTGTDKRERYLTVAQRRARNMQPLIGPVFDSSWRADCRVEPCSVTQVDEFVQAHYLHKRPAIVLLCLMVLRRARLIGCVIYSAPPREADKRYGGKTWELARLYLLDEVPKNGETWLIGRSVRWIRQHHPEVQHLVSYADPSVGHKGTIYRAANWREDGRTEDERKTPRCDYYDERTGKKYGRRGNMPADAVVVRKPRVSKHRFTLALRTPSISMSTRKNAWSVGDSGIQVVSVNGHRQPDLAVTPVVSAEQDTGIAA